LNGLESYTYSAFIVIASKKHTIILLSILAVVSLATVAGRQRGAVTPATSHTALYVGVIVSEWALLRYAVIGVRKRGLSLLALSGLGRPNVRTIALDLAIAAAIYFGGRWLIQLVKLGVGPYDDHAGAILPHGPLEVALWFAVSASAGICEELVYRGYFQLQFAGLTASRAAGVVLQAVAFGLTHGYQGWQSMTVICVYGVVFGVAALLRRSVLPGILAHTVTDIVGGLSRAV
jgi:membrane protease YdiL (CAAX protease family)